MSARLRQKIRQHSANVPQFLVDLAGFVMYTARRFITDGMTLAAGALTFSTLLALVPLMVIAFAILSGFATFDPTRERMEALFLNVFVPEFGAEVGNYLAEFSRNATNLTVLGIIALAVTAVMLLWTIEATLNQIWRVQQPRSIGVRVLIYWTVLTLGPLLLGASFVLTSGTFAALSQWGRVAIGLEQTERALPTLGMFVALIAQSLTLMILFKIVPARPVRLRHAALGGVMAGVGIQLLRLGFDGIMSRGTTYDTVYGAVAILPIFLFWLYLSWSVVILGAVVAASLPDWRMMRDDSRHAKSSPAHRLEVAVAILAVLAHHARNGEPVSHEQLQETAPLDIREELVDALCATGYIIITEQDRLGLLRDLHVTTVADLARDLNLSLGAPVPPEPAGLPSSGALRPLLSDLYDAESVILERSLHDVIFTAPPTGSTAVKRAGP